MIYLSVTIILLFQFLVSIVYKCFGGYISKENVNKITYSVDI